MGLHTIESRLLNLVQDAGRDLDPVDYVALIDRIRAVLAVEASRCDEPEETHADVYLEEDYRP